MESKRTKAPDVPDILAQWSRMPVRGDSPAQTQASRARIVDVVVRTMLSPRRPTPIQHRLAIRLGLGAAAAAVLIAAFAIGRARVPQHLFAKSDASVVHRHEVGAPSPSSSATVLGSRSQSATDRSSSSRLQLVSGVEVVVGPETRLTLPSENGTQSLREELALELGVLQVHVPKLPKGAIFSIRTPNAVVSVHGTAFSVEVMKSGPSEVPQTRVIVTEGVVAVQHAGHELLLDAGTEWTSAVVNPPVTSNDSLAASKAGSWPTKRSFVPRGDHEVVTSSKRVRANNVRSAVGVDPTDLANENHLFAEAMSARDRGDGVHAVALLDDFIIKYPACPLTEDAYVARFRVLSRAADHAAAAKAARAYLALYPDGLAGQEARALAVPTELGSE